MKVKVKAKVICHSKQFETLIYAGKKWRVLGTPYSIKNEVISPYKSSKNAKKGAEVTAKALGITLVWEVAKSGQ